MSPLAAPETFTQRRMQIIGVVILHSKGSVNGVSACLWMSQTRTCALVTGADAAEDEEVDVTTVDPIVAFCSR